MKNIRQRTLGFVLMGIGLVLMAVGVYELAQKDMFKASVRLQEPANFIGDSGEFGDAFETSKEVLLSETILSNVVYRLELREKWDKKLANEGNLPAEQGWKYFTKGKIKTAEIVSLLQYRLQVIQAPNTNTTLFEVVFLSDDAAESALVANTVAEVYRDWRNGTRQRLAQGGIEALQTRIKIEDEKIKAAKEELQRLRKELSIPDAEVESASVRTNFPKYWDAKMNLERLNDVRRLITRKMNIEEIDLNYPLRYCPVEIINHAVPAKTPIRRHRPLGAAIVLVGLALFGCGLASVWKSRPLNRRDSPA